MKNSQKCKHQHYINLFTRTCKIISVLVIPCRDNNFEKGTMWWLNSYDLDFRKKLLEVNKILRVELFKIFGIGIKNPAIDNNLMLADLLMVRNNYVDQFQVKYNP